MADTVDNAVSQTPTTPPPIDSSMDGMDTSTQPQPPAQPAPDAAAPDKTAAATPAAAPTAQPAPTAEDVSRAKMTPGKPLPAAPQLSTPAAEPPPKAASWVRKVAETLAGGPRFKDEYDSISGTVKHTQVHLSKGDIGMAIALEALSGGLAGLAAKGPNAAGQGGMLGLEQGQKIKEERQRADAEQAARANGDYARAASTARANMEMAHQQRILASEDYDAHAKNVGYYAPILEEARKAPAGTILKEDVSEGELLQMMQNSLKDPDVHGHITRELALPMGVAKKIGPDGKQVTGPNGEQEWEERYAVLNPHADLSLPPATLKLLQDNKVPGYVDSDGKPINFPSDMKGRIHLFVQGTLTAANSRMNNDAVDRWNKNKATQKAAANGGDTTTKPTAAASGTAPTISEMFSDGKGGVDVNNLAGAIAAHEGFADGGKNRPSRNNNPGDIKAAYSKNGKLTEGDFAKNQPGYDGYDKDGFAKFKTKEDGFNALQAMLQRDMPKYGSKPVDQYVRNSFSDGGDKEVNDYVGALKSSASATGWTPTQAASEEIPGGGVRESGNQQAQADDAGNLIQTQDAVKKGLLTNGDLDTITSLTGMTGLLSGRMNTHDLLQLSQKDPKRFSPDSIGRIINYAGNAMDDAYQQRVASDAAAKTTATANAKTAADAAATEKSQRFISQLPNFRAPAEYAKLSPADLEQQLKQDGVKELPTIFDTLYLAGHYGMKLEDFAQRVWAKGSPDEMDRQTAIQYIRKYINPNFNEQRYTEVAGMIKAASNPTSTFNNQVTSFQQFLQHVGEAVDANDALRGRKDAGTLINQPISWWKEHMSGDTAYTDFIKAIEPAAKEYESFLLNNHALHESDKQEIQKLTSGTMSMANAEVSLKRMAETAAFRAKDVDDKWYRVAGTHFPNFINDEAVHGISKLTDAQGNNKVADLLGHLDNGGDLQDSATGWGNPGRAVHEALGRSAPAPLGATGQAPDQNGQMHWTDGKRDLGVVKK